MNKILVILFIIVNQAYSQNNSMNEFNLHKIPDSKNNYRSAQIPIKYKGINVLSYVIDSLGIKRIIRLNGDGDDSKHLEHHPFTPIQIEKNLADKKNIDFYTLSSVTDQKKVDSLLNLGNTLIHCAHGADRTGGNVGGYLYNLGWGDTEKIWDYTTRYNSWERMVFKSPKYFVKGGFLRQAKKFGVKDLKHAQELSKIKL